MRALNISTRKVGGIRFLKLGRLTFAFSVSREYRALGTPQGRVIVPVTLKMEDANVRRL